MTATDTYHCMNAPVSARPMIVVIGLNRSGTTSLHNLFDSSNIASLHWRRGGTYVALAMLNNISIGKPPFAGLETYQAFSDLAYLDNNIIVEAARYYREIFASYPNAYFILNTRPVDDWIASRLAHGGGGYLSRYRSATGLDEAALVEQWRALHARHDREVTAFFDGNPRFLRFDITTGDPRDIATLVAPDFDIDPSDWSVSNQGPTSQRRMSAFRARQTRPRQRADNRWRLKWFN